MATQYPNSKEEATFEVPLPPASYVPDSSLPPEGITGAQIGNEKTDEYPHGFRLAAIVISLMLGMFLVALDNVGLWPLRHDEKLTEGFPRRS